METANEPVAPPKESVYPATPTPWSWRLAIALGVVGLTLLAFWLHAQLGTGGGPVQAALGIVCFVGIAAFFSSDLRAVNRRTLLWGFTLQILLVLFITRFEIPEIQIQVFGYQIVFPTRPGHWIFEQLGAAFRQLLDFTNAGASFVFGKDLAKSNFAFAVLPTIIFIASFFSVLYYFGILQLIVRVLARIMMYLMGTSGAETLSVSANIFMGQTEAPLIIKPYVPRMTQSEVLTMMVGGMAHISGSLMAVYMEMGGDPVAILATSVMAAPGSLYLSKLVMPELGQPETRGYVKATVEQSHANVIDAAATGASDGMRLALNVAAMLIAFVAFIAMFNALLGGLSDLLGLETRLSLERIFSWVFYPVALLMGVEGDSNISAVAELLGKKLVVNEFIAYTDLKAMIAGGTVEPGSRTAMLATYALTGFANFSSIAIQIGGIGGLAPSRRQDLARLGPRALLTGFLVTLINASIAGMLL
jgi:CNT family concentrative nucleoside transporter